MRYRRLTIVIPCYNAENFVGETLQSVQEQTYTDWECIAVDDGSTDDSAEIISGIAATDPRIRMIRQQK